MTKSLYLSERMTYFYDASESCSKLVMSLVTIENSFLYKQLIRSIEYFSPAIESAWTVYKNKNSFLVNDVTNKILHFPLKYHKNQQYSDNENCLKIEFKNNEYKCSDHNCFSSSVYICESIEPSLTEPSASIIILIIKVNVIFLFTVIFIYAFL